MENSKFFTLFSTLTIHEVPAFHRYLRQLHGRDNVALQVFEYVRKLYPKFEDKKKLGVDYIYQKLFGAEKHENPRKKILDTLSDLHLWLKDFLLIEKLRLGPTESQILWLDILQERGLQEDYSKQLIRFYDKVKEEPKKDAKRYLVEMVAGYSRYQQISSINSPDTIAALQECLSSLETCAETIRIRLACQLANTKKVHASRTASPSDAPDLKLPEERIRDASPLLDLSCNIYQLIETEEEKYYDEIEKEFKANKLHPNELHGALGYLHNYVAIQSRNGRTNNIQKIHELNQLGLKNGLFSDPANMSAGQFNNIVALACSVKDYEWALYFIKDRQVLLPEDIRGDIILLARATVASSRGDNDQVLTLLNSVEFRGAHNIIRSKLLILKSLVELDQDDTIEYCLKFENWLINRPIKTEAIEATLATVRIIKMLILKKDKQENIQNKIDSPVTLYNRSWLQEKAQAYKARYAAHQRKK